MADLKIGENFQDRVFISNTTTGVAATGLSPVCVIVDESGNRANGTVAEMANGWYKVTDFTPDAAGTWCTEWQLIAGLTIHYPFKMFKVSGGYVKDSYDLLANATYGLSAINTALTFQQQADAFLSQANPVSDNVYEVLATTANVEIVTCSVYINWAVTQPTNLRIIATVDGRTRTFTIASPVSGTVYGTFCTTDAAEASQSLVSFGSNTGFVFGMKSISGRSVRIQTAITWGVTQPTLLVCRVKYAKR